MKFKNKKEEFNYYSLKAIEAEKNGDRKSYLVYLKIASEILKQIEEEEKKEIEKSEEIDEIEENTAFDEKEDAEDEIIKETD